ncbi:MAG: tRNA (cytidine(34)-2'-O)-methyltransferase [Pseudomonadales bacterium]|nr:tRNA (cytidine(34)-2'-O)-methyltransferase [Pseudomonadales bacterium]MDG1444129.1 tRNA (cytidine(34)-2'-O)-methyltransferase [Pseudomonadales bacterium]
MSDAPTVDSQQAAWLNVVLYEPEIPPNTGNIIRLCANTGAHLHVIEPLGFQLDDKRLRRAGLDYHEWASMQVHENLQHYYDYDRNQNEQGKDNRTAQNQAQDSDKKVYMITTKGQRNFSDVVFEPGDSVLFGPETRGLPQEVLTSVTPDQLIRIPMLPDSRSLNLSNAVATIIYEAWRQQGYSGSV